MGRVAFALVPVVCALLCGCETFLPHYCDRSDQDNPWIDYDGGVTTFEDSDEGAPVAVSYDSSPENGEMLLYKGGIRYRLYHGLGRKPATVAVWLSFDEYVTDAGTLSPSAGDQSLVNYDSTTMITVVNNSCVDYFIRVTAE